MKASIRHYCLNQVRLMYDDIFSGERITRKFFCSNTDSGYVYELKGRESQQVCDNLSIMGNTLYVPKDGSLIAMIRLEYKKMKHNIDKATK